MKKQTKVAWSLAAIPLVLLIINALTPMIFSIFISMRNFYAGITLSDAELAGWENYRSIIFDSSFKTLIKNAILTSGASAVIGSAYIFASLWGIGHIHSKWLRALALCAPLLLICIPVSLYADMIFTHGYLSYDLKIHMYPHTVKVIFETLSWASVFVVAGSFLCKNEKCTVKRYLAAALVFFCIRIIFCVCTDVIFNWLTTNDMMMQFSETLSLFVYHRGGLAGDYGYAAAGNMIKTALTILPAIVFAILYPRLSKCFTADSLSQISNRHKLQIAWSSFTWLAAVGVLILCILILTHLKELPNIFTEADLEKSRRNFSSLRILQTLFIPLLFAIITAAIAWLLTYGVSSHNMALTICCILLLPFAADLFGKFVLILPSLHRPYLCTYTMYFSQIPAWVFIFLLMTGYHQDMPKVYFRRSLPALIMSIGLVYGRFITDFSATSYNRLSSAQTPLYSTITANCIYPTWQIVLLLVIPITLCFTCLFIATALIKE